jgi:hypothetical protein
MMIPELGKRVRCVSLYSVLCVYKGFESNSCLL